jgi:exosortase
MVLSRRERLARAATPASAGQALLTAPLWAGAAGIAAWSTHTSAPDLLTHALQLWLLGAGAWIGGRPGLRIMTLPTLFLFLAVPIPAAWLNALMFPLQLATVETCVALLGSIGVEAIGLGDQIFTERGIFHVIETCSGIRLVQSLLMAAIVYGELFARRPARIATLVLLAPAVGLVVNLGRILSIIFNPWASISAVHTTQGVFMVVVGVLAMAGLDRLLERRWPTPVPRRQPAAAPAGTGLGLGHGGALAVSLVALLVAEVATPVWTIDDSVVPLRRLPKRIAGRVSEGTLPDFMFLGNVHFSDRIHRLYTRERGARDEIDLLLGEDDHLNRRGSLLSGKTASPGRGMQEVARDAVDLTPRIGATLSVFEGPETRVMVLHWREGFGSPTREALRSWLGLDRSPLRRDERAYVWRVSAALDDATSEDDLQARLIDFGRAARRSWDRALRDAQTTVRKDRFAAER